MGLEDLIKQQYQRKTSHHDHDEHHYEGQHDRYDPHDDHSFRQGGHHNPFIKFEHVRSIFQSLLHKKALLAGVLIICIIMIIAGIALLCAIFPLITQALGYVETNGIKGIADSVLPYVDKLWKGNG
jgi:hypothetical protein